MSRFALSRRSALALMGGAATFGLTGRIAHAAGEIKVLNWQGYGTDEKWALAVTLTAGEIVEQTGHSYAPPT